MTNKLCMTYTIPLKPIAWSRAGTNWKERKFYDTQIHSKNAMGFYFEQQHGNNRQFHKGPIKMDIGFYFPIPKSIPKRPKDDEMWMTTVPDQSNCLKFIEDTLVRVGILKDDRYICHSTIFKKYSKTMRIEVTLTEL